MHNHTITAALQIVPLVQDKHPYEWVDEVITIIKSSGLPCEVNAFSTTIEGSYDAVMEVFHSVQQHLYKKNCAEWLVNLQLHIRAKGGVTCNEKTVPHR